VGQARAGALPVALVTCSALGEKSSSWSSTGCDESGTGANDPTNDILSEHGYSPVSSTHFQLIHFLNLQR
jgi:hypothetical protein